MRALWWFERPEVVTYSPKAFAPVARLCHDRYHHHRTFVATPREFEHAQSLFLSVDEVPGRPAVQRTTGYDRIGIT